MPISMSCACGKKLKTKDENAGKQIRCPACERFMSVPALANTESEEDNYEMAHKVRFCPQCKKEVDRRAVLCVACGYNFKTGKTLRTKFKPTTVSTRFGLFRFFGTFTQIDISRMADGEVTLATKRHFFFLPIWTSAINLKKYDTVQIDVKVGQGGEGLAWIMAMFLFWHIRLDQYILHLHGSKQRAFKIYHGPSQEIMQELVEMLKDKGLRIDRK